MKMRKLLGLLLMGAAMFSSCGNDHEDLYDPNAVALMKANEYAKAFVKEFGKIDPNHTWGFGDVLSSRATLSNANDWYKKMELPSRIMPEEVEKVKAYFGNPSNYKSPSVKVNWSDFFVQHVYKGEAKYTPKDYSNNPEGTNTSEITGSDKMNQLHSGVDMEHLEVIENFNNGSGGTKDVFLSDTEKYQEGICLKTNSGTLQFAYANSNDSNNGKLYYDYIVQEIDGNYYVAFDYKCESNTAKVEADGIYNDWIIKISPAVYKNNEISKVYRIIAEDLGTADDFDFNDVVFDVAFNAYGTGVQVTVQAAGGTLPLCINGFEVHELLGVDTNVMVNTGESKKDVAIFKLEGIKKLSDIVVTVDNQKVGVYQLNTEVGSAPQMICVDTNFEWPAERENINNKYNEFKTYVGNQEAVWY